MPLASVKCRLPHLKCRVVLDNLLVSKHNNAHEVNHMLTKTQVRADIQAAIAAGIKIEQLPPQPEPRKRRRYKRMPNEREESYRSFLMSLTGTR